MTEELKPAWAHEKYNAKERAKNYTAVIYPEDAPIDWIDSFTKRHLQLAVSPLHDMDVNPDGERKKMHYHVLITADGNWVTMNDLAEIGREILGMAIPQVCKNPKGLVRYFTHQDNPEKYQYEVDQIQTFGGIDLSEYLKLSSSKKEAILNQILDIIRDNEIRNIIAFEGFIMRNGHDYGLNVRTCREIIRNHGIGMVRLYFDGSYQQSQANQATEKKG